MGKWLGRLGRRLPVLGPLLADRDRLRAEIVELRAERERLEVQRSRLKAEQHRRLLGEAKASDWWEDLLACQEEIARDPGTRPTYAEAYRSAEFFYWSHIPAWMAGDAAERPLESVLDVGCGYGTLALLARRRFGAAVDLIDFNPTYLSAGLVARHHLRFALSNVELDDHPWPGTRYTAILLTETLEHLNFHPVPTLEKLRRLLAPGGHLYLSTPDASEWGRVTAYYPSLDAIPPPARGWRIVDDHVWQYTEGELRATLGRAGFVIERLDFAPGVLHRHLNVTAVALPP